MKLFICIFVLFSSSFVFSAEFKDWLAELDEGSAWSGKSESEITYRKLYTLFFGSEHNVPSDEVFQSALDKAKKNLRHRINTPVGLMHLINAYDILNDRQQRWLYDAQGYITIDFTQRRLVAKENSKETLLGLIQAHEEGNSQAFAKLCERIDEEWPTIGKELRLSIMMSAAETGKKSVVLLLIKLGMNPDEKDFANRTALDVAARAGQLDIVKTLLHFSAPARPLAPLPDFTPSKKNKIIAPSYEKKITPALLEKEENSSLDIQLLMAVNSGEVCKVADLIKQGASPSMTHEGESLLHRACKNARDGGNADMVSYLACVCDPQVKNSSNKTCMEAFPELSKILKRYNKFNDEVYIAINLVNASGELLKGSPRLISSNAKMVQVVKMIDPGWNEFKQNQKEHQRWDIYNPLPYTFKFGGRALSKEPSGGLLENIVKVHHTPVPFLEFPITIEFSPVEAKQQAPSKEPEIEKLNVFQNVRTGNTLLKKVKLSPEKVSSVEIDCSRNEFFDAIEFALPPYQKEMSDGELSIFSVPIVGMRYPTFELKTAGRWPPDCLLKRPKLRVQTKPELKNCKVYTYYPSLRVWVESCSMMMPALNAMISLIPKVEVVPGFSCFLEQLLEKYVEVSGENVEIAFEHANENELKGYTKAYYEVSVADVEFIVANGTLPTGSHREFYLNLPTTSSNTFMFTNNYKNETTAKPHRLVLECLLEPSSYQSRQDVLYLKDGNTMHIVRLHIIPTRAENY